jgi:hypothetical protein
VSMQNWRIWRLGSFQRAFSITQYYSCRFGSIECNLWPFMTFLSVKIKLCLRRC